MDPRLQTSETTTTSSSSSSSFKDPQKKQPLLTDPKPGKTSFFTDPNLGGNYSNSLP
jgi:hypothetical protein